ncbi:MAG TPA: response regulator [Steroidobacteraceae bacterium]|jgi:CheY-like chemotaxis protein
MERSRLRSVLYVEDEPDIRDILQLALSLKGELTVHTRESGGAALELLRHSPPDLVLLDAMMPEMDGPATLAHMRADPKIPKVPVVFVTAKAMPEDITRLIALGACGVIPKPFDPMRVTEELYAIWEGIADVPGG